ncbi:hypothetical protein KAU11_10600 [Candidatus Babeliales bacterium]|nr:hypothetical protein [Candidatus Babeliales bacterium]
MNCHGRTPSNKKRLREKRFNKNQTLPEIEPSRLSLEINEEMKIKLGFGWRGTGSRSGKCIRGSRKYAYQLIQEDRDGCLIKFIILYFNKSQVIGKIIKHGKQSYRIIEKL